MPVTAIAGSRNTAGKNIMTDKAVQEYYPDSFAHCYECGTLNEHGLPTETHFDGEEGVCRFTPKPHHIAVPGFVYGGLIASLIDCHCIGTAAAAHHRALGHTVESEPVPRFVTGSLHVDYLKPTPLGPEPEIRARVSEIKGRKVVVTSRLFVDGVECARGEVVAIQMPDNFGAPS